MKQYQYEVLRGVHDGAIALFEIDKNETHANEINRFKESFQRSYRRIFRSDVMIYSMHASVNHPQILLIAFAKKETE